MMEDIAKIEWKYTSKKPQEKKKKKNTAKIKYWGREVGWRGALSPLENGD
jgi:hypothetical protein